QRPAVLHADEGDAFAFGEQAFGIVGGEREADPVAILADDAADRGDADQSGVARVAKAFRRQRALPRVDDKEAAIERTFLPPRQGDLGQVTLVAVPQSHTT